MTREDMMELKAVVRRTMEEQMEMYSEVWLTADELVKYFGTFKKAWLDRYGHSLPRKRPRVTDEGGDTHGNAWLYPRNKIQRMFANGEIEKLVCKAVITIQNIEDKPIGESHTWKVGRVAEVKKYTS